MRQKSFWYVNIIESSFYGFLLNHFNTERGTDKADENTSGKKENYASLPLVKCSFIF
jgi:hypothetical protein